MSKGRATVRQVDVLRARREAAALRRKNAQRITWWDLPRLPASGKNYGPLTISRGQFPMTDARRERNLRTVTAGGAKTVRAERNPGATHALLLDRHAILARRQARRVQSNKHAA